MWPTEEHLQLPRHSDGNKTEHLQVSSRKPADLRLRGMGTHAFNPSTHQWCQCLMCLQDHRPQHPRRGQCENSDLRHNTGNTTAQVEMAGPHPTNARGTPYQACPEGTIRPRRPCEHAPRCSALHRLLRGTNQTGSGQSCLEGTPTPATQLQLEIGSSVQH